MKNRLFLTSLLLAACPLLALADVRYTTKTKIPNSPVETSMTTWVKGKRQRTEMVMDMGTTKTRTVMLTLCDTRQTGQLDPDLKIYYLTPMNADGKITPGAPGTGTISNTYTVKDLGTETVAQLKAHHWMVTTRSQATGCIGNYDNTSRVEVWTAPVQVLNCPEATSYSQPTCKVKFVEKGDVNAMRAAYNGMPVRMVTYQGETQSSEQTMVDYSTKPLDAGLFAPPKDYKQVTQAEFQQQQQQKMMKQYQQPNP